MNEKCFKSSYLTNQIYLKNMRNMCSMLTKPKTFPLPFVCSAGWDKTGSCEGPNSWTGNATRWKWPNWRGKLTQLSRGALSFQ